MAVATVAVATLIGGSFVAVGPGAGGGLFGGVVVAGAGLSFVAG